MWKRQAQEFTLEKLTPFGSDSAKHMLNIKHLSNPIPIQQSI